MQPMSNQYSVPQGDLCLEFFYWQLTRSGQLSSWSAWLGAVPAFNRAESDCQVESVAGNLLRHWTRSGTSQKIQSKSSFRPSWFAFCLMAPADHMLARTREEGIIWGLCRYHQTNKVSVLIDGFIVRTYSPSFLSLYPKLCTDSRPIILR